MLFDETVTEDNGSSLRDVSALNRFLFDLQCKLCDKRHDNL